MNKLKKHHYFLFVSSLFLFFLATKKNLIFQYLFLDHNFYDNLFGDFMCFQRMNNSINNFLYDPIQIEICAYPRIWILISRILNFHNQSSLQLIIFLCFAIFVFIFYNYIKKYNSLFFFYFFFSGATLSLIQKANIDLIIFLLLFFAFRSKKIFTLIFFFLLSIVLKLYPIFALPAFFYKLRDLGKVKKYKFFIALILSCLFVLIYFVLSINDIKHIMTNVSRMSGYSSYGLKSITDVVFIHYNIIINHYLIGLLLLFISFISFLVFNKFFHENTCEYNRPYFLLGSLIYIFNFLVFINYDFRLILLIFVIPSFLKETNKVLKYIALISIVLSTELVRIINFAELLNIPRVYGGGINIFGKLLLFIILFSITLKILFEEFLSIKKKCYLRCNNLAKKIIKNY